MHRLMLSCIATSAFVATHGSAQDYSLSDLEQAFDKSTLIVSGSAHTCYLFHTFVARNSSQRARGLMFVRDLPEFTGMLFIYDQPAKLSMWMKNTYIPLDILFFSGSGEIVNIAENTVPLSLDTISSTGEVSYVLELNAGLTSRLEIDQNSLVIFSGLD